MTMLCKNPYIAPGMVAHPCGQCIHCRVNWSRKWTLRMLLEASEYDHNAFLTLTYDDEHVPRDGKLEMRHLTLYLKRLRKHGLVSRYFAVGEYGSRSRRPHYHAIIFGKRSPHQSLCDPKGPHGKRQPACVCHDYQSHWPHGRITIGPADHGAMAYCAQYSTGKLQHCGSDDTPWVPMFRQSRRPGLGVSALDEIASSLLSAEVRGACIEDVPTSLRMFGKSWPLDRYLRAELRKRIGRDPHAPASVIKAHQETLQPLREAAKLVSGESPRFLYDAFRNEIVQSREGKHLQVEAALARKKKVQL